VAERGLPQSAARRIQIVNRKSSIVNQRGFTMIEIALCLAIMGFALVAIIGVLPLGMNTQRDNREATVIGQDATVLLEAVRDAARGADYLTNNVYQVINSRAQYASGVVASYPTYTFDSTFLTNGANIVGVLSTPEFTDLGGNPLAFPPTDGYSNHIVAYVRSLSGLASEKPPQDNAIMVGNTFTYRVYCVNAAVAFDTNSPLAGFSRQLNGCLHELRMTFLWPQLPNGNVGAGRQTFRTSVAGRLAQSSTNGYLFYYSPQFFTNAP
jgi:prepilin-type N-terminal cleavage/methylation domain-containing protein